MATVNLGRLKFMWQGAYSAGTAYVVDDVVSYNGSTYICTADSTGNDPTNTSYWDKMAAGSDIENISGLGSGDMVYFDGSAFARLPAGTSGHYLKTNGSGSAPEWVAVPVGVKEVFYQNFAHKNTSVGGNFFTHSFTPTVSGSPIAMYTIAYRMASTNHLYAELFFNNSSGAASVRYDGYNYPASAHSHLQSGSAIVRVPYVVTPNVTNQVYLVHRGGDTANSGNDGPYGFSSVVWIV